MQRRQLQSFTNFRTLRLMCLLPLSLPLFPASVAAESTSQKTPIEIPVWPGEAPGSEGVTEEEIVVERGDGVNVIDRSITHIHHPSMFLHRPESKSPVPAVVICPGGGLTRVVIDKEGHALAEFLNARGIAGVVLKYRTAKTPTTHYGLEPAVADAKRAVRLIRANAEKWNIDPQRVGVFGFSAGGILAATLATHYDAGVADAQDHVERQSCRPDFVGMAYPITTVAPEINSRYTQLFLGENPPQAMIDRYRCDQHVNADTPPVFLCHAGDDQGVPITNSERFQQACQAAGVPCTFFRKPTGGHGFGLRQNGDPING